MAKLPTITSILSGFGSTNRLNLNFSFIQAAFNNTLSLDGSSPNAMAAVLDMNSNKIINLKTPTNTTDAATKGYVDTQTDSFAVSNPTQSQFAKIDLSNIDGGIINVDSTNHQVSVGYGAPVAPVKIKLYVNSIETQTTAPSSESSALSTRLDYQPTGDNSMNVSGVYGTAWLNKAATYSGGPAAIRGNIYTIDQGIGNNVNVAGYIAGGIFRARQEASGTVAQSIAVLADAAQQGPNHGTITKTIGVRFDGTSVGTQNFGAYFNNTFNSGSLASSPGTDITVAASESLGWTFKGTGYAIANSSDLGVLQLGTWGELVTTQGAYSGITSNLYSKTSDGTFRYRNTHASVGGSALLHNVNGFQTTSFYYSPPGTANAAATIAEYLRVTGSSPSAASTCLMLAVNNSGGVSLQQVTLGAADSGGTGFRALRVPN